MWYRRLLLVFLLILPLSALAGDRIALVVSMQNYLMQTPLIKTKADAKLMADSLTANGVRVINSEKLNDLTIDELNYWFDQLTKQAANADEVYIYFAGHGFQHNNAVYLLATNSPPYTGSTPVDSFLFDSWLDKLREVNPKAQRVIWLDTCRDNPLNNYNYVSPSYLGVNNDYSGNLIIYAAAKGAKVKDNNPLAEEMSERLKLFPHTNLVTLSDDVAKAVKARTNNEQVIEIVNTLDKPVCPQSCNKILTKQFIALKPNCINTICLKDNLTISTTAINHNDLNQMINKESITLSSELANGCWTYKDNNFSFSPNMQWNSMGLDTRKTQCLSMNDAKTYALWYTSKQADGYNYRIPTFEESSYIAAYFKQEADQKRLAQCMQKGDNAPCYSHPQLGVYLVRK